MTTDDPVIARIQLGILLRELRDHAGYSTREAGDHVGVSEATISRIENGRQGVTVDRASDLLQLYTASAEDTADGLRLAAVPGPKPGRRKMATYRDAIPNSFQRYLAMESEAAEISMYEELLVPGVVQTRDYTTTLVHSGSPLSGRRQIERQVDTRMGRQVILTREDPPPPRVEIIVHEAALHRVIGDNAIMQEQLQKLLQTAELPNVTLRVLPFRPKPTTNLDEAFSAQTSFYLLKLPDRGTLAYIEDVTGGTYPEDFQVIQMYANAYQRLRSAAADPDDSRALIDKVSREYT